MYHCVSVCRYILLCNPDNHITRNNHLVTTQEFVGHFWAFGTSYFPSFGATVDFTLAPRLTMGHGSNAAGRWPASLCDFCTCSQLWQVKGKDLEKGASVWFMEQNDFLFHKRLKLHRQIYVSVCMSIIIWILYIYIYVNANVNLSIYLST